MTQKWEYRVVRLIDGRRVEELSATNEQLSTVEPRDINEFGEEGWELINVVKLDPERDTLRAPGTVSVNPCAYFKRPLLGQAEPRRPKPRRSQAQSARP